MAAGIQHTGPDSASYFSERCLAFHVVQGMPARALGLHVEEMYFYPRKERRRRNGLAPNVVCSYTEIDQGINSTVCCWNEEERARLEQRKPHSQGVEAVFKEEGEAKRKLTWLWCSFPSEYHL